MPTDKPVPVGTGLEALVRKIIPAAVIFAEEPEHVADLRNRALAALKEYLGAADTWADEGDPERQEGDPSDFAANGGMERGEVFRAIPWKAMPEVWIACGYNDEGTEESRAFDTEAEARAWAARPDPMEPADAR